MNKGLNFELPIFISIVLPVLSKRLPPPKPIKLIYTTLEIDIPNDIDNMGFVIISDVTTNTIIIRLQLYAVVFGTVEMDIQNVFITEAYIERNKLIVKNEIGYIYSINLETYTVKVNKGSRVLKKLDSK